jgi:hypothetical protein
VVSDSPAGPCQGKAAKVAQREAGGPGQRSQRADDIGQRASMGTISIQPAQHGLRVFQVYAPIDKRNQHFMVIDRADPCKIKAGLDFRRRPRRTIGIARLSRLAHGEGVGFYPPLEASSALRNQLTGSRSV